jgi:hypothetical protein
MLLLNSHFALAQGTGTRRDDIIWHFPPSPDHGFNEWGQKHSPMCVRSFAHAVSIRTHKPALQHMTWRMTFASSPGLELEWGEWVRPACAHLFHPPAACSLHLYSQTTSLFTLTPGLQTQRVREGKTTIVSSRAASMTGEHTGPRKNGGVQSSSSYCWFHLICKSLTRTSCNLLGSCQILILCQLVISFDSDKHKKLV